MITNNVFQLYMVIWCNKCSHNNGTNTCNGMMEIYMNHNTDIVRTFYEIFHESVN